MTKIKLIPIILLMIILSLTGCAKGTIINADSLIVKDLNGVEESNIHEYVIDVDLDTDNMKYMGKQTVKYVNNTDINLEEVYFHLYPNAFKTLEEAPILFDLDENMDPLSYIPGNIEIKKVSSQNKDLEWNIDKDKDTILHIELEKSLNKGDSLELYLEYTVKLPTTEDRFGYNDKSINLGNWYPVACVYDNKGWNLDPYYKIGDPFYSETSNYNVSITTDKNIIVASSGNIISETIDGDKKIYEIEGRLIRDFAWAASENFVIREKLVDDTLIKVYSIEDNKKLIDKSLDVGEKSIKIFNRVFGKYPYGQYSIVITKFPSGMEYPGIVFISDEYPKTSDLDSLEIVIVHETAHQWWYGLVGNDQVEEAWLDEALAAYSETIYIKELYSKSVSEDYYNQNVKMGYEYSSNYLGEDKSVNKPLSKFEGWNDYGPLVYSRGAMFIHSIKEEFGEEVLYEILQKYFDKYKFHIATTEDFIAICEEVTKTSFESQVELFLNGNK